MRDSIKLLGTVTPDVVISSAFAGETAVEAVDTVRWSEILDQALASVDA
jgi:hypothetical protein